MTVEQDWCGYEIFDCHAHFADIEERGITPVRRNIMFNEVEEYRNNVKFIGERDTSTLIFDIWREQDFVFSEIDCGRASAVKLIPRDQSIDDDRFAEVLLQLNRVPADVPVFYDSFRHGHDMRFQPRLEHVIAIAVQCADRAVVVSHAGGHQLLDYFLHLRTLPNIYYDLSLVLQYFYQSSVFTDIKKLIQHTPTEKILFGSDYPWTSLKTQLEILFEIGEELSLNKSEIRAILHDNCFNLLAPSR